MTVYFGMAQWQHPDWVNWLYPSSRASGERLRDYAKVFNSVEVGSSFYAQLSSEQLRRWYDMVPDNFCFVFKAPQEVTHQFQTKSETEILALWSQYCQQLQPFEAKLGPVMLQFPASLDHRCLTLIERLCHHWPLSTPLSVEVRNLDFFDKSGHEVLLLKTLADLGVNRVVMDSRPVFSTKAYSPALVDAQRKKPRVPCHPVNTSQNPVVRFIGHPDLERNQNYIHQWLPRLVAWLEAGLTPYLFVHTADNIRAPELACQIEAILSAAIDGYEPTIQLPERPNQFTLL